MMNKIVIALDPEGVTEPVVKAGIDLARKLKADVDIVSVVPRDVDLAVAATGFINEERWDKELQSALVYLFEIKMANTDLRINVDAFVGDPRQELRQYIQQSNATFIVLGTHGRSGIGQVFMGGTAEYIVRHSTIPLVIVPLNNEEH